MPAVPHLSAPSLPAIGGIFNNPWGAVAQGLSQLPETASADTVAQQQAGQTLLDSMRKLVARNPKLANDPSFVRRVQQYGRMYNIDVPTDQHGGLDLQDFLSPGKTLNDLSPAQQSTFMALPAGAAKANFLRMNGINEQLVPQDVLNAPPVFTGAQREAALKSFSTLWQNIVDNGESPMQFLGALNIYRPFLDPQTFQELSSNSHIMSAVSAKTNAQLQVLHANGILNGVKTQYYRDLADYERANAGYKSIQGQVAMMNAQSAAKNAIAHMISSQAAAAREAAYATHSQNQDSIAGVRNHLLAAQILLRSATADYDNMAKMAGVAYKTGGPGSEITININGQTMDFLQALEIARQRMVQLQGVVKADGARLKVSPQTSGASPKKPSASPNDQNPLDQSYSP